MSTITTEHVPTFDVPENLREPLAGFFGTDATYWDDDGGAWIEDVRIWAQRASEEVQQGRLTLHDERDCEGDRLGEYIGSAVETFPQIRGFGQGMPHTDRMRLEAGLLLLAADIQEHTAKGMTDGC